MRIAVVGAGGAGGYSGARLAARGAGVTQVVEHRRGRRFSVDTPRNRTVTDVLSPLRVGTAGPVRSGPAEWARPRVVGAELA